MIFELYTQFFNNQNKPPNNISAITDHLEELNTSSFKDTA
jgi:hypothetical protein